jgi:pyridoxal phosphate enzyme (YggS family)
MSANSHQESPIAQRISAVREAMAAACARAGRDPQDVRLIGAAKTRSASDIEAAFNAGLDEVGENYLQEALPKIAALAHLPLTWHYIGAIQSNKTKQIAEHFDWVHTISRLKIAQRLNQHRSGEKPLNVLIQVNIDADPAKAGVSAADLQTLLEAITDLPALNVRGLMTIPARDQAPAESFSALKRLFDAHSGFVGPQWDTLSMGMSQDLDAAITAGSTMVRIGTAIFGKRTDYQTEKGKT